MKLDVFSKTLDAILKEHFTAFVMKGINKTMGFEESKENLMNTIQFKYGAMMLGQDKSDELYSFYPLWYEYENKTLMWYDADWISNFTNPLETESGRHSWELILNCTQSSEKLKLLTSGKNSKKCKNKNKKFDCCFDIHATDEVNASVEGIGEYHKFILAKAFREQGDEVTVV